jgi:hypothetical protein
MRVAELLPGFSNSEPRPHADLVVQQLPDDVCPRSPTITASASCEMHRDPHPLHA